MKALIYLVKLLLILSPALLHAQSRDTLRNMPQADNLIVNKYSGGSAWGYWTGHNHLGRQQFAEKYYISGNAVVKGVIAHLAGYRSASSPDSSVFNIWTVGASRMPANIVASKVQKNKDLDLSGAPYTVYFDNPVAVSDSFFVAYDLYDYSHHSHADTIALRYGPDGSRPADDKFGRNVIQVHSHGTPTWRDFATQNFTNIRTHLAIYPIVEFSSTGIRDSYAGKNGLKLYPAFPNPASGFINVSLYVPSASDVRTEVLDLSGMLKYVSVRQNVQGELVEKLLLDGFAPGAYTYIVHTEQGSVAGRFIVQ